jgi:hypothetical protein
LRSENRSTGAGGLADAADGFGHAEIDQLHHAVGADEDIVRRDVAMNDAAVAAVQIA